MRRPKLAGPERLWKKCGNTPYYYQSLESFPASYYTNPFSWMQISVGNLEEGRHAGSFSVLYRHAPRYDWDAVKAGIRMVTGDKREQTDILKATHEWAHELMKAQSSGLPQRDLRKIFESAPETAQDLVLEGVAALLYGDMEEKILESVKRKEGEVEESMLLVVVEGSPAYEHLEEVKEDYRPALDHTIVVKSVEEGLEKALEFFGIYEC